VGERKGDDFRQSGVVRLRGYLKVEQRSCGKQAGRNLAAMLV
jgi:hypothetical protein